MCPKLKGHVKVIMVLGKCVAGCEISCLSDRDEGDASVESVHRRFRTTSSSNHYSIFLSACVCVCLSLCIHVHLYVCVCVCASCLGQMSRESVLHSSSCRCPSVTQHPSDLMRVVSVTWLAERLKGSLSANGWVLIQCYCLFTVNGIVSYGRLLGPY